VHAKTFANPHTTREGEKERKEEEEHEERSFAGIPMPLAAVPTSS
jgi:hypothetical protein